MNAQKCLTGLILFVLTSSFASAAVISRDWKTPGDGLLTYDTVSGWEWLDFSPQLTLPEPRFDSVLAETGPGGVFEGFQVASIQDVLAMAESAGVTIETDDFATNGESIYLLNDLLTPIAGAETHIIRTGLTNDPGPAGLRMFVVLRYRSTGLDPIADILIAHRLDHIDPGTLPVFLYRTSIPEPSVTSCFLVTVLASAIWARTHTSAIAGM